MNRIKSEIYKLIINPWLMLASLFYIIFSVFLLNSQELNSISEYKGVGLNLMFLLIITEIIISSIFIGSEFGNSELRTSLISDSRRIKFFYSKILVILILFVILWLIVSIILYAVNPSIFISKGNFVIRLFYCFISIVETIIITSGITMIFESKFVSLGLVLSLYMGIGDIVFQITDKAVYLVGNIDKNVFTLNTFPFYLSIEKAIIVNGLIAALVMIFSIIKIKRLSIR